MGFDAGSIKAQLELDKTSFDRALDEAIRRIDELEAREVTVDIGANADGFNDVADEVDARKRALARGVEVPITADTSQAERAVKQLTSDDRGLPKEETVTFGGRVAKSLSDAREQTVREVERTMQQVDQVSSSAAAQQIIRRATQAALDSGLTGLGSISEFVLGSDMGGASILEATGLTRSALREQVRGAISGIREINAMAAASLADSFAGHYDVLRAFSITIGRGAGFGGPGPDWSLWQGRELGTGSGGFLPSFTGGFARFIERGIFNAEVGGGYGFPRLGLPEAGDTGWYNGTGLGRGFDYGARFGARPGEQTYIPPWQDHSFTRILQGDNAQWDASTVGSWFNSRYHTEKPQDMGGFSPMGVLRYLQDSRPGMALSGGLSSLWSGLGSSTAVPLLGSMPMAGALALGIGSAGIVSALGMAAGAAAGGIISGLGIGIPGLAAGAYGGYTAFQRVNSARNAASTLQSTLANLRASGLGPGSAQWTQALTRYKDATGNPAVDKAAAALSRLAAAATAVTHGMTKGWYPVLTQAFNAGTKFLKQPAIHSFLMNSNRGMQDFVRGTAAAMSDPQTRHDFTVFSQNVRPLMDKVGTGVGRLAQGGLSFIADFAPMAQVLASMFERWATGVDKFFAHFKLGKGTIDLVVGVLHDLGSIIGSVVGIVGKLVVAFAPIGKILLDIISYVVKAVAWIVKMIPPKVLTVILGAALVILTAIWLLFMANPVTLIILGIIAVGVAIYALATHWKQVWTNIKNWAVDAWQAIDNEVIHPIMRAWSAVSTSISGAAKTAWRNVKQWAVDAWQAIDNNVFHPIASAWHTVVTVITTAWSTAWGAVKGVILAVWNWIKTNIVNPIKSVLSTMWNGLVSGVRTAVGLAVTAFGPLIHIINTILRALGIIGNSKGGLPGGGHMPHYGPPLPVPPGTPIIRGGGPGPPNPAPGGTTGHALGQTTIHIHVDARGSTSAAELTAAAQRGVNAALRAAMQRGALRPT